MGPAISTTLDGNRSILDLEFTSNPSGVTSVLIAPGTPSTSSLTITPGAATDGIDVASNAGAITISAPIVLGANQRWAVDGSGANGSSLTVSAAITGTANLEKTGAGILTLSSASNTYVGTTTVSDGILQAGIANGFNATSAHTIGAAGTLRLNNVAAVIGSLAGSGTVENGPSGSASRTLTTGGDNTSTIFSGVLQNGGPNPLALTKVGTGAFTLSGPNTYTGTTTVSGGVLNVTGSITGNPATSVLAYGGTAANTVVNVSGNMTLFSTTGGNIAGGAAVYNQTAGTVNVTGNTTSAVYIANAAGSYGYFNLTGGTYKDSNRFALAVTTNLATPATAVAYIGGNGILDLTDSEWMLNYSHGHITVAGNGLVDRTGATAFFGLIMNSTTAGGVYGVLNVAGGSFLTTTQAIRFGNSGTAGNGNNNSAFINLAAGTLQVGAAMSVSLPAAGANNAYLNFAGGTLKTSAAVTNWIPASSGAITFTSTIFGPVDNSAVSGAPSFLGGLTIDTNGFNSSLNTVLGGASGVGVTQTDLTVAGGSGYIGAPSVIFSTAGVVAGGTPAAGYALISGGAVTGIVITSPGTYTAGTTPTITLTGGGGTGASVTSGALATVNVSGGLTKIGGGILTLSGANTYTGGTTISAGTLALGAANVLADIGNVTIAGGTFDVATFADTVATVSLQSGAINGTSGVLTSTANYDLRSGTVGAILAGSVGISKSTSGTVTLSGVNTFSQSVNVTGGVLSFATSANLGDASATNTLSVNGATLRFTGPGPAAVDLTTNRVLTIGSSGATLDATQSTGIVTLSGGIASGSTGNLIKTGAGTVVIPNSSGWNSGANSVDVQAGTLQAGFGTGGIAALTVGAGGYLNMTNGLAEVLTLGGTPNALTLVSGARLLFELGAPTTGDRIIVGSGGSALTSGGVITLDFLNLGGLAAGTYSLLSDPNGLGGLLTSGTTYALGTAPGGFNYTINQTANLISLSVVNFVPIYWRGGQNASWSTLGAGPANWTTDQAGTVDALAVPGGLDTVIFSSDPVAGPTVATTLDGNFTIDGLQFRNNGNGTPVTTVTINQGTSGTLTLAPSSTSGGVEVATSAGAVTINAPVVASNANVASQTWSVVGGGANGSSLAVIGNLTINALINKTGAGVLTLGGANGGAGGLTLTGGTLNIDSDTALGTGVFTIGAGTVINNTSGALRTLTNNNVQNWNGNFAFTGTDSLNLGTGAVTLGGNVAILASNATLTVGGAVDDGASTFSLTKAGAGTLVFNGANAYDGLTDLIQGVLTLGGNNVGAAGGVTMASGTTLNLGHASALGTGVFTINGGTIDNSSGGALVLGTNNLQSWNAGFTFTGSNNLNLGNGAVTLGSALTVTVAAGTLTVGGVVDDGLNTFNLTKAGSGTLALNGLSASAPANFSGTLILDGGTTSVGADASLTGGVTFGISNASTLVSTLDLTTNNLSIGGPLLVQTNSASQNNITLGTSKTLSVVANVTIGAAGSGTNGRLTVSGASGQWNVNEANLTFRVGGSSTATSTNVLTMTNLGTFFADLSAGGFFRLGSSDGGSVADTNTVLLAVSSTIKAGTLDVGGNTTHSGTNTLTMGTGVTTINANTIDIGSREATSTARRGSGAVNFAHASNGSLVLRAYDGTSAAALNMISGVAQTNTSFTADLLLAGHNADVLVSTLVLASRAPTASANTASSVATLTFNSGTFTATGTTTLSSRGGSSLTTGDTNANVTFGGGTVTLATVTMSNNSASTANSAGVALSTLTFNGNGTNSITTLNMGTSTVSGASAANDATEGAVTKSLLAVSGSSLLTIGTLNMAVNSSTVAVTGATTSMSTVNISGGAVSVTGNISMGNTTANALNVVTNAINLSGGSLTVGGNVTYTDGIGTESATITLSGTGLLDMTAGNIGSAGALITFNAQAGTLQNLAQFNAGAGLVKTTSGTLILEGTNSYTGGTTISGGVLQVGSGGATGTLGSGTVVNDATLTFNRNNAYSMGDAINGSGQVVQAGSGTTTLSVANGYAGLTSINSGVLHVTHGSALGTTAAGTVVTANAALELSGAITTLAESLTLSGNGVSSGGALRSVSGTNTFLGAITLAADARIAADAGLLTLDVASGDAVTGTTAGLTFSGAGNILVADGISLGSGGLTKTGAGIVRLAGVNSYSGQTTISGGVLTVNGSLSGTSGVQVTAGTLNGGISGAAASISSSVTVASGATISAGATGNANGSSGNGVGQMNITGTTTLTLDPGALMVFDFAGSPVSSGTQGTDWDYFTVGSGGVTLSSAGSVFVSVDTWLDTRLNYGQNAGFSTTGNLGDMANPAYSWLWITNAGTLNGFSPTAIPGSVNSASFVSEFVVTTTATFDFLYSPVSGAGFWVSAVGSDLYMNYSAVPEPSSLALVGLAGLGLAAYRRRKRKLAAATETIEQLQTPAV